ncbi:MAG: hypothetical protein ACYSRP_03065 [Planctomycetota bacterium]|jgi:hypothetical protein
MAKSKKSQTSDIREILKDTVEVQLAGLIAGATFWREWANHASKYTEVASKGLANIISNPSKSDQVLSEITDAGQEYMRTMNELPQIAVSKFKEEFKNIRQPQKPSRRTSKNSSKRSRSVRAKA